MLHSKPPVVLEIFRDSGIKGLLRCAVKSAADAVRLIRELDFNGMNITAPFKENIIPFLDKVSGDAASIGAVNTIINNRGVLTGYNTDHYGVTGPLKSKFGDLADKKCLVSALAVPELPLHMALNR